VRTPGVPLIPPDLWGARDVSTDKRCYVATPYNLRVAPTKREGRTARAVHPVLPVLGHKRHVGFLSFPFYLHRGFAIAENLQHQR
jgi:hypothetical protein